MAYGRKEFQIEKWYSGINAHNYLYVRALNRFNVGTVVDGTVTIVDVNRTPDC
jgi:hypothetical protein